MHNGIEYHESLAHRQTWPCLIFGYSLFSICLFSHIYNNIYLANNFYHKLATNFSHKLYSNSIEVIFNYSLFLCSNVFDTVDKDPGIRSLQIHVSIMHFSTYSTSAIMKNNLEHLFSLFILKEKIFVFIAPNITLS